MQRARLLRLLALLLALGLMAAACGDDADETAEDDTAETAETTEDDAADDVEEVDADGMLIGYIFPESGPLASLGPPQIESFNLAVEDINDAGGVLGEDLSWIGGDEAGDAAVASESADRLIGEGVHGIVGAAASGMTGAILDQVAGSGIVQCSGSNTAPVIDEEGTGYYFRTAPTDALQAPVLGEVVIGEGNFDVSILARSDDYGEGFLSELSTTIEEQGGTVLAEVLYDPEASSFTSDVDSAVAPDPEAVVVIGFEEGGQVLAALIEAGYGPQDVAVYTADGMRASDLWESVDPDNPAVLEGLRGTAPGADPDYNDRLLSLEGVNDPIFGGQVYDCVVLMALAAQAAGSWEPEDYVDEMRNVSQDGTACSSYEECLALLEDGEDIDYQGVSGSVEWNEDGDVPVATYEVFEFDAEGVPVQDDTVEASLN